MKTVCVLQQAPHEDLGSLSGCFREAGLGWRYVQLFRETPSSLDWDRLAGLVVLGGPMNVDEIERYPFLSREVDWIREAVRRQVPLLGICLGAQLLAKALGGQVSPNGTKEIGWYEIDLTDAAHDDPLFGGSRKRPVVFQWHGDTFSLPEGAVLLATSPQCRHQAFRVGGKAWGVQFHVEMTAELVDRWLTEAENCRELESLDYIDPEDIRRRTAWGLSEIAELGDRLLPRFAALCQQA